VTVATLPELRVTVFSDYICPFCYVGSERLEQLRDRFDLKINWCSLEIHPDTPPEGKSVTELGYSASQWSQLMAALVQMVEEDQLPYTAHEFTTNSRSALLLAESVKEEGADAFYPLHRKLFEAFFVRAENIGDRDVLRRVAAEVNICSHAVERAWEDERYEERLKQYAAAAHELNVAATPTFFIGRQRLDGAVPASALADVANRVVHTSDDPG